MPSHNLFLLIPGTTINSCHPCSHLGSEPCAPFYHDSVQASCIVTTTNFLAVYKAVNQNHAEWGGVWVEEGPRGRSWVGCWWRLQEPWTRCQSFTLRGDHEAKEGGSLGLSVDMSEKHRDKGRKKKGQYEYHGVTVTVTSNMFVFMCYALGCSITTATIIGIMLQKCWLLWE